MEKSLRVLVVDDERTSRLSTRQQLIDHNYIADVAENGFEALEKLERNPWDVVITDMRMPSMDGLQLLEKIKLRFADIDVILITAYGTVETAVTAIQEGAADYLTKPFRFAELDFRLQKILELRNARKELDTLRNYLDQTNPCTGLIGCSPLMQPVCQRIELYRNNDYPVLITGETGTGKELVAKALHQQGDRSEAPFIALACGAIPKELAESELFGHEKGAFTHALQRRIGSFERANGGTLLLDDVDDLPLDIQVKLLRVLQENVIIRVGGNKEIPVDVRVIATTKENLEQVVNENRFRSDLFYRLRGLEIYLPTLKDRGDDILLLAQYFLDLLAIEHKTKIKNLSVEAANALRHYEWPGNVRELRHAMESTFVVCYEHQIELEHLPKFITQAHTDMRNSSLFSIHLSHSESVSFNELIQQFEDTLIQWALAKAKGQQSEAADLLNLPRTTFQSKIKRPKNS